MSERVVSIGRYYFLTMNLVILLTAVLSFGLAIQSSISRLDNQIELLSENLYEEIRSNLKADVESAVNLIDLVRQQTEERYRDILVENVRNAQRISRDYYRDHRSTFSIEQMQKELRDILRSYRFFDGEGYYFLFSTEGEVVLYPVRPELEGSNNMEWQDEAGNYFIKEMLNILYRDGEGYLQYKIFRPGKMGESYWKESYITSVPELNLIIGSGYYIEDLEQYAQNVAADSLDLFGVSRENPFFATAYNGMVKTGAHRGINRITNPLGNSDQLIQDMSSLARSGGGYFEYLVPSDGMVTADQRRISFILPYPDWEWFIGTGTDIRDLSDIIESERRFILQEILRNLILLLVILVLIYGLLFILMRRIASPVKKASDKLIRSMEQALERDEAIALDGLAFREFRSLAESTNRILQEKQISQKALFQKQKMEALGRLAGGVAHDINNQLTGVMGFADLISTEKLSEEGESYLESLLEGAQRASDMVRELLVFSRGQEGPRGEVDLHEILERIRLFLERTIDKNIQIRLEPTAKKYLLTGDGNKIYSLFLNLAINSVDALEKGGVIILTTRNVLKEEKNQLQVEIRDNGCGIEPENLEKIFELFFTTKPAGKGTGLGLALVYDIVKEQGGTITVESELDSGTLFTVLFPLNGESHGVSE